MKRTKLRKESITPVSKLKKQLWKLCREIIIERYGSDCYTCTSKGLMGGNRQVGHFIPSSVCSAEMRYSLDNLRIQCAGCNIWKSGNWLEYEAHLTRDGIDVDELKKRNQLTKGKKYDSLWYLAKIEEYKLLIK